MGKLPIGNLNKTKLIKDSIGDYIIKGKLLIIKRLLVSISLIGMLLIIISRKRVKSNSEFKNLKHRHKIIKLNSSPNQLIHY